jgi:hypothetical protein
VAGARRPTLEVAGVVTEPPASFHGYMDALRANPKAGSLLEEGWRIGLVDLRKLCAAQPEVFLDAPVPEVDPDDLEAIADITLQLPPTIDLATRYDKSRRIWTLLPTTPNFRVVGQFQHEVEPGVVGIGFAFRVYGSFMQAVRYRDRYLLRDGYHRAAAFLARGIHRVPALVGEFDSMDSHFRQAMLPTETFLGSRPPLLPDYFDDDVSAEVLLPGDRRVILIQEVEVPVPG